MAERAEQSDEAGLVRRLEEALAERQRWQERAREAAKGVVRLSREIGHLRAERTQQDERIAELERALREAEMRVELRDIMAINPTLSTRAARARLHV